MGEREELLQRIHWQKPLVAPPGSIEGATEGPNPTPEPEPKAWSAHDESFRAALEKRLAADLHLASPEELLFIAAQLGFDEAKSGKVTRWKIAELLCATRFRKILEVISRHTTASGPSARRLSKLTSMAVVNVLVLTVVRPEILVTFRDRLSPDGDGKPVSAHNDLSAERDATYEWIIQGCATDLSPTDLCANSRHQEPRGSGFINLAVEGLEDGPDAKDKLNAVRKSISARYELGDASDDARMSARLEFFYSIGKPAYTAIGKGEYERYGLKQLALHFPHLLIFTRQQGKPCDQVCTEKESYIVECIHQLLLAPPDLPKANP